ncbi:flagellar hook-associated protein FlgL [Orenia marismortui]|uniref:flagellar hook-associated protein FlgL n=1 Tax=Orenia marismortui TaxID=46469 RepID=UPI000368291A|nr:flagellar hook-associated protein FlgL [Orenia marismortui]
MTRITNNMIINNFRNNYQKNAGQIDEYMDQISTGNKFNQISEDPIAGSKVLDLQSTIKFSERYIENIDDGTSWLSTTDQALSDTVTTLRSLRDLAVQGSNDTMNDEDREKLKNEVDQLKEHILEIANSSYNGLYIFNGTKTQTEPYQSATTDNSTDYLANGAGSISTNKIEREIAPKTVVPISISGDEVGFSNMLADLNKLSTALESPSDSGEIQSSISRVDQHINSVLSARGKVGAIQNRLDLTKDRLESEQINNTQILSDTQDVDIAESITNLKNAENVYRASLSVGARIIQPTLMEFLR